MYSNETKDYKYILPLISEINKNHIYILFENNDDIINIRLPLNTLDVYNDEYIYNFIYKEDDLYEPIYYFNDYNQSDWFYKFVSQPVEGFCFYPVQFFIFRLCYAWCLVCVMRGF